MAVRERDPVGSTETPAMTRIEPDRYRRRIVGLAEPAKAGGDEKQARSPTTTAGGTSKAGFGLMSPKIETSIGSIFPASPIFSESLSASAGEAPNTPSRTRMHGKAVWRPAASIGTSVIRQ
jgi:hypothetical protein